MNARDRQRHSHRRPGRLKAALRVALVSLGTAGLSLGIASPATAQGNESHHEAMHGMMNAMHGRHTAARMHKAEGAEQMMQECSTTMESMSAMGRMMGPMMGGGPRR
jgi:hypothetical protein